MSVRLNPSRKWVGTLLVLFMALLEVWAVGRVAADPSFRTELSQESIPSGESVVLSLVFTDLGDVAAPTLPAITNCTVAYQGASRQISIVNFSQSSSLVHQFVLQPDKPGVITIPALAVEVGGKTYTSAPLVLRVGQGFDPASIGFLRLVAPKPEVYVGETFPLEIRFYSVKSPERQNPPTLKLDGFVKGRQTVDNLPPETISNVVYSVVRWSIALTTVKAGELTVGPAEFQTLYSFSNPSRRRSRGLESLFEPMLGGVERRQINFQSDPLPLKVLNPPPKGRPADFDGLIGRFQIDCAASPTNVAAGDPITVRIKVTGRGNFDAVRLPDLPSGSGFQLYPGTNSFSESDPLGLTGTKTFEAVLVPDGPGVQTIQWPWVTSWDPGARMYVSDRPRPWVVNVRPGANAQAQPAGAASKPGEGSQPASSPASAGDLALLQELGPLVALTPAVATQHWFWGLMVFPLGLYVATLMAPILRQRGAQDPARVARQKTRLSVANHLDELRRNAVAGHAAGFFSSLNGMLQLQLSLVTGGHPGAFTDDVVDRVVALGLDRTEGDRLGRLFERLDEARFSPTASGAELNQLLQEAEQLLAALRQLPEAQ